MAQKIWELYITSVQNDLICSDAKVLEKYAAEPIQSGRVSSFPFLV